ncbi:hypothetical protein [Streptomyces sp. NPDC001530]|uniref:hypothetical protein n=1 Tax=Streptomyces sp. NPDC001530 TaxID=3364582 RepID=UPI0036842483
MTNDLPPMPNTPPTPAPKPPAKRRRNLIVAAVVAVALAIGGTAYWLSRPSYDDIVKDCQKALAAQYKANGKGKPSACKDVKDDDYDVLVLNAAMGDLGWLDDDGNFDKNKMLESTLDQP